MAIPSKRVELQRRAVELLFAHERDRVRERLQRLAEHEVRVLLVQAGFEPRIGGIKEGIGILPGDLDRFPADKVGVASIGEVGGVLESVIEPRAAFDPIVAGELVPGEQVRVVENKALRIFVGLDSRDDLVRPSDELRDRRNRLRPPGGRGRERIAVLKASARHAAGESALVRAGKEGGLVRIGDRAHADRAGVGDRSGFIEFGRLAIETREQERLPDLADGIDEAALPRDLSRGARVIAGDAAQQAFARDIRIDERVVPTCVSQTL